MRDIGIGIVGGGYMGKAHSVAMAAVGAVFNTALRPRLEMICATSDASAQAYRAAYGFARATGDWRVLVDDPRVQAVVIASPQEAAMIRALPQARGKLIVTPGVRPAGAAQGDQKRIATPAQAIADGADHIVVGRPIWQADDPAAAARAIVAGLG